MKKYLLFTAIGILLPLLSAGQAPPYRAGDQASDFHLKNVRGEMVSMSQFNDVKGFIVAFWCNTCPFVKKYEQRLIDLDKEFRSKGFPVIAINSNDQSVSPGDSYGEMQKLAKNKGYTFEYLYDESQDVARSYGATNTPHVYLLLKKAGKLIVQYVGAIDNNADNAAAADKQYLREAIKSLLNGEQIAVKGTRAVGCSLKWKRIEGVISSGGPRSELIYYRMLVNREAC
jgi:peroxiredoxin